MQQLAKLYDMKSIIAQVTANNQVTIRYVSRPSILGGKQEGDKQPERQAEREAVLWAELKDYQKWLSTVCSEYNHINKCSRVVDLWVQTSLHGCDEYHERKQEYVCIAPACNLCPDIEIASVINNPYLKDEADEVVTQKFDYYSTAEIYRNKLDIIKKYQQGKKQERSWGKPQRIKKFSRHAKQRILEAGAVMDEVVGKYKSYELTLTIPGSGYKVYRVVSEWSGYIIHRMTQVIRRYKNKGYDLLWFFVWEHQKRGALHQHWCLGGECDSSITRKIGRELRMKWFELLEELSEKTRVDLFAKRGSFGSWRNNPEVWQWSFKPVRKSVAAYFSKYCSKNVATSNYNKERRDNANRRRESNTNVCSPRGVYTLCPSRYWGAGSSIKQLCSERRVTVCFNVSSSREGDFVTSYVKKWLHQISNKVSEVSRNFEAKCSKTGFIYAKGWQKYIYVKSDGLKAIRRLFRRLRCIDSRLSDGVGAVLQADDPALIEACLCKKM